MIDKKIWVEVITVGDEILIGQIVDTNSAWIGVELNKVGLSIIQITSIRDDAQHIIEALNEAKKRASIVIITGGLGPTKDDITKKTLFSYFESKSWVLHQPSLAVIEQIFAKYNAPLLDVNIRQADVPDTCEVLLNEVGTAPGMLFKKDDTFVASLPGVPHEMMYLVEHKLLPILLQHFTMPKIIHQTILTAGVGESFLAEILEDVENELPDYIKLAYLPKLGQVRLRLSGTGDDEVRLKASIDEFTEKIIQQIPDYWISKEDTPIEKEILKVMSSGKLTLSLAESCTGGALSQVFTQHEGSSEVFMGGAVVYSNQLKEQILGVSKETLLNFGAVSEETVKEMVQGALQNFNTDYAIAVTGIAGPGGGTDLKPVGTVYIAVASKNEVIAKKFIFGQKRMQNIERSITQALFLLYTLLKKR